MRQPIALQFRKSVERRGIRVTQRSAPALELRDRVGILFGNPSHPTHALVHFRPGQDLPLEFRVGGLELPGPLGHPVFELGVEFRQTGLRGATRLNLGFELDIHPRQHARAGQRQGLRHQPDQQDRRQDGGSRRERLDGAGEPIVAMPDVPDFHQVRRAAGKDKSGEAQEEPAKIKVSPLAHEPREGNRNGIVRQSDQPIGNDMEPNQARRPEVTMSMRHERSGGHGLLQEGKHMRGRKGPLARRPADRTLRAPSRLTPGDGRDHERRRRASQGPSS
jgi:hypothetical protein